jgi:uncharacterized membrane protein
VGYLFDGNGPSNGPQAAAPDPPHSFRWTEAGGLKLIKTRDGKDVEVTAISANGQVAVGRYDAPDGSHVFRWTEAGGLEDLGAPDRRPAACEGCGATATAVSADGSVIFGRLQSFSSFWWTRATGIQDLDLHGLIVAASADGSTATGIRFVDGGEHLFVWSLGRGFEDIGAPSGLAADDGLAKVVVNSISADGSTIVGYYTVAGGERAFRWTRASGFQTLAGDGDRAHAWAVSGDGSEVVGATSRRNWTDGVHAARWVGAGPAQPIGSPGLNAFVATSVSADGRVVAGQTNTAGEQRAFVLRLK